MSVYRTIGPLVLCFLLEILELTVLTLTDHSLQEPSNLKAKNSFRYNGLVRKKTVGVEPCKDGKGVVLVTRNARGELL